MDIFLQNVTFFFLTLARIISFLAVSPFFGNRTFLITARISLALLLTILLFPMVVDVAPLHQTTGSFIELFLIAAKEVLAGLILGFAAQFIFWAVRMAGQIISFLIGFSIVNSFNPDVMEQMPIIAQLKWLLAMVLFLVMDGHFLLLEGLAKSFQWIPLLQVNFSGSLVDYFVRLTGEVFVIAIQISAPILVTIFMTNVSLAMLARMVPQMNVFILGFPLTISLGILTLMITLPAFLVVWQHLLGSLREALATFFRLLGP